MNILLLDKEIEYTRQLGARVSGQFPQLTVYACDDSKSFEEFFTGHKSGQYLCLYNLSDFPRIENLLRSEQAEFSCCGWKFCRLVSRSRLAHEQSTESEGSSSDQTASVERAGDYSKIALIIEHWHKQISLQDDLEIVPQANSMVLYLDLSGLSCDRYVSQSLKEAYRKGYRTLYLPLMPLYHMRLVEKPDKGLGLSDLLLKMSGELVTADQISHYWQATDNGWYQFRPPVFSEDLLSCSADQCRKMISLLKTRLVNDPEPSYILLDCRNISFNSIHQMAVLCNHVFIRLPAENSFALTCAEKEAARLINKLPATCGTSLLASDRKQV